MRVGEKVPSHIGDARDIAWPSRNGDGILRACDWRRGSESNRRTRLCRPLHDHSATPPERGVIARGNEDVKTGETGFRRFPPRDTGAAEESRTLDLNLGKVALYQLSYCRDELRIIPFPGAPFNRIPRKTQGKTPTAWASTRVPRAGS